ncbi:hypothetical protein PENFLA_c005G04871 [Penicillium flavigenum]|uniref:Uncharacterized protein n=1 Tax=Penicillium flavigenum TaxID=254877 RepID=A0A1V6TPK6_9EURO|nr:hypothetical protein PENFLA_c005G04871 [Penicillium flavigenum]
MTGNPYSPMGDLSRQEAQEIQCVFQECFEKPEHDLNAAIEQGKYYFVREHALRLVNPTNISQAQRAECPPRIGIPSSVELLIIHLDLVCGINLSYAMRLCESGA